MHLTLEALARLVDEPAAPGEAAHLRDCLVCRRELAELRAQTASLAALGGAPSAGAWDRLAGRLEEEGLVRAAPRPVFALFRPQARAAAAVALFLLGGAAGAALWGGRAPAPLADARLPAARADAPAAVPVRLDDAPQVLYYDETPAPGTSGARLVSTAEPAEGAAPRRAAAAAGERRTPPPGEAERAARELFQAQAEFVAALQRLAAAADPASGNEPAQRMAALERLVALTAGALERAPGDPVINGYHLAAVAERDALRRQMDRDAGITWF